VTFREFSRRVGENVRRARWAAGMTQEDLAAAALTLRVLSQLEGGLGNPTLRTLFTLAKKLNVRVAEFIDVEPVAPGREPLVSRELRPPKRGRKPKMRRISR
jgi:transcriptional regulator with XRE-family HTH domain